MVANLTGPGPQLGVVKMFLAYKIGAAITYAVMIADTWLNYDLSPVGNLLMNVTTDLGWAVVWPVTWVLCLVGGGS